MLMEGGFTSIAFAVSFAFPRLAGGFFRKIERAFGSLARRQGLAVLSVGLATLLLRIAILPVSPIPLPFVPDDFSFQLAGDTFAHGRLANPAPEMWTHFESIHITMQPTYVSMYFPAQGLALAAGKVLFGNPWFAVLILSALMCSGICWMLQAWLPPSWALAGGVIAIIRLGLFSYWVNTYSGGGLITALGGALVLGSLPRLTRNPHAHYGFPMGIGIALLVLTRPYEGMLLCLPVAFVLGRWALRGANRPATPVLLRRAALPLLIVVAAISWLGYYDYRAFGKPTTLPYTVDRATYAMAPYYVWQQPRPEPVYHHEVLRRFYKENELDAWKLIHKPSGFLPQSLIKLARGILFFAGLVLVPPLFMLRRVLLDRRIRFLVVCVGVLILGLAIEIFMIPHYLAPFTCAFYAIGLQAMRHLRLWHPGDAPVGQTFVRLTVTAVLLLAVIRLFSGPLHFKIPEWPASDWSGLWYGPEHFGSERAAIEAHQQQLPGKQLVIVRYWPGHNPLDEWVYNAADIDTSKVIWAREMNPAADRELINHYSDRQVWLVEPDAIPAKVNPYWAPWMSAPPTTSTR